MISIEINTENVSDNKETTVIECKCTLEICYHMFSGCNRKMNLMYILKNKKNKFVINGCNSNIMNTQC